ncbi:UNVERIFIED_CONTAM: hypothetical protein DES50_102691 [Williamsia faeni]
MEHPDTHVRTANWRSERARVAALSRDRAPDDPKLIAARRNMRALKLTDHVQKALAESPPLTTAQRHAIGALFFALPVEATQ